MEIKDFTYIAVVLSVLLVSVGFSFGRQTRFLGKLKYFFPSVAFSGAIYALWTMRFAELGIWNYNPDYITGIKLFRVPIEELLFILTVSYFSMLIFETVKTRFRRFNKPNFFLALSFVLLVGFGLLAFFYRQKLYTFFTFFLLAIYFGYTVFRNRFKKHYTSFYLAYFISLVPFVALKAILIALPAVSYHGAHILGLRLIGVPVEDFGYFFLLLLMNVTIYEYLNERRLF